MKIDQRSGDTPEHREISALLPWYVNATLGEPERERIDAHLSACAACRETIARERLVFRAMTADSPVEYIPAASLKRLQARLDATDAGTIQPARSPGFFGPRRRPVPWQGVMAASVAVMAVALGLLAGDRWMRKDPRVAAAADYYTVTTGQPRARGEVIRAVFSPTLTLVELQGILDESQLRIISGPTEAGVYSLAANSQRPVSSSLALLRAHAQVRFAEGTQPTAVAGTGAGNSP